MCLCQCGVVVGVWEYYQCGVVVGVWEYYVNVV